MNGSGWVDGGWVGMDGWVGGCEWTSGWLPILTVTGLKPQSRCRFSYSPHPVSQPMRKGTAVSTHTPGFVTSPMFSSCCLPETILFQSGK